MLQKINDFMRNTKVKDSGAKRNRCYTKKGPGRMPHDRGHRVYKSDLKDVPC